MHSELEGLLDAAPQLDAGHLADLTSRFVQVPSVNGETGERALALAVAAELEAGGLETVLVGSESRPSVAATTNGEPRVLLNGHLDTVPVVDADEWRTDPFAGAIEDGFVHGRGACDMKGGLAVQVAVAQWLAAAYPGIGLVLHFAMGEERGEPGTESLIEAGFTAPLGIVLEPTDLRVGIAQRGLMTLRVVVEGRSGHASRPDLAINPIEHLALLLGAIERLGTEPTASHPLLGSPTWTPTVLHAGVIPSMVPDHLELLVDRRMVPGETVQSVLDQINDALAEVIRPEDFTISVAEEEGVYAPAEIPHDSQAVSLMSRSLTAAGLEADLFGTPYSSDVRHLINTAGIEAITFGPGRISEAHARDERVRIRDLERAARVVATFVVMAGED